MRDLLDSASRLVGDPQWQSAFRRVLTAPADGELGLPALKLLSTLYWLQGKGIISGQHDYLESPDEFSSKLKGTGGAYAGLHGYELGAISNQSEKLLSSQRQAVTDSAIRWHKAGGIVTMSYHAQLPGTAPDWKNVSMTLSEADFTQVITPGTAQYSALITELDKVAVYLSKLNEAGVPVLWRPYHEMNGGWFWWGQKRSFRTLWNLMFERFTVYHKLHNLLWVWSPNARNQWCDEPADYYPGSGSVDILALDIYDADYRKSHHDSLWRLGCGKLIAVGECGELPNIALLAGEQPYWSYQMTWGKLLYEKNNDAAIAAFMKDPFVFTRDAYAAKAAGLGSSADAALKPGLYAQYYNNVALSGTPALVRTDALINFNWRQAAPDPAIAADLFSVRWSGRLSAAYNETYSIYSSSDDGIRVWIDGLLIIDSWMKQSGQERQGSVRLIAGKLHELKVEYYENQGDARAVLMWESASQAKSVIPAEALYLPQ
ncbi:glycosyl hydrolase [Paenibacillus sp. MMS20-IR301]|uniref:glycosyl hydrolase n=1 Tax=Paenibacillus sp. MMS20-IR301 TaxID=2895946 RepID=UPI0028E654A4|nr:glycosyl hydrolase [Paenibacillus sp. MMS20-IR301]WNS43882.1 glycosyl hydrolase [Paenibacillus sp. MMS20-IR301]